jgi:tetratricopeptide (TPR) repeat protein
VRVFAAGRSEGHFHAQSRATHAQVLLAARRPAGALAELLEVVPELERRVGAEHPFTRAAREGQALAHAQLGQVEEARSALRALGTGGASRASWRALRVRAAVERMAGDPQEAERLARDALAALPDPARGPDRARVLGELGAALAERGAADAASTLEQALALWAGFQARMTPDRADAAIGLGRARLAQGRPAEALPLLAEADAFWRGFDGESRWAGEAALWLGRCQRALGQRAEAHASLARAASLLVRSPIPADARLAALARER